MILPDRLWLLWVRTYGVADAVRIASRHGYTLREIIATDKHSRMLAAHG